MPNAGGMLGIFAFGAFELDLGLCELRRAGRRVSIEPKAFALLAHLISQRHRVVTKHDLLGALWPDEAVTPASLTYCVKAARQAVGDTGARQTVIATVRGHGFRFVAPVRECLETRLADLPEIGAPGARRAPAARGFFVGRQAALATLHGGLENALAGRGRIALLVGEPGIGKTRTAEELAATAAARGALVLFGRCYEGAGAPAFWPWIQVVRASLSACELAAVQAAARDAGSELAQIVPELSRWLPPTADPPTSDAAQTRFRLFDSASAFLRRAAEAHPLVIILDDLHWADTASLLLLEFVARELGTARLLVLGTCRNLPRAATHPLNHCLGELARVDACHRIELHGLPPADIASFLEATTGTPAARSLVDRVAEQTGGNPFFLTELARLLTAQDPRDARTMPIPGSVREAVARRIETVAPSGRALLRVAAVFGREFELPVLAHMLARDRHAHGRLLDGLDQAIAARLIEPVPGATARCRFVHALVRETLYDGLSSRERLRLHASAGDALAAVHAEHLEPYLDALAHHYGQAALTGDAAKAVDYAVRAGRRAASIWAYEEAAVQLDRALELREHRPHSGATRERSGSETSRDVLLRELGENLWKAGDVTRAKETFQRAAALGRAQHSPAQFARAALGFGGGFRGFDLGVIEPALIALLEEALRLLPRQSGPLRGRVMARLAVALYHVPDSLQRRQTLSREAVAIAERSGDPATHLAALYSRHWAIWGPDNLTDRLEAADAMIRLAEHTGDREMALHGRRFHLIDSLELGDLAAVDADLAACAELAAVLRQPYYRWYAEYLRAMRTLLDGRLAEAERLADSARTIGQRAESRNVEHLYGGQVLWIRREQGRLAEAEPAMRQLAEQYPALPSWRCGLLYVLSQIGRLDEARLQLDLLAARNFADLPRNAFWLVAIAGAADAAATLNDAHRAGPLTDLLAPYADRVIEASAGAACLGSVRRPLGRLAATRQRWSEAAHHFEAAIACHERIGAPHLVAHARRDYAEMLLTRGDPRDSSRTRELLAQAADTYQRLAMDSFANQTALLLERVRDLRRRTAAKSADHMRLVR